MPSKIKAIQKSSEKISCRRRMLLFGIIMVLYLWAWHGYSLAQDCKVVENRPNGDLIISCNGVEYRAVSAENYRNWLLLRELASSTSEHNKILVEQVDLLTQANLKLDSDNKTNLKLIQDLNLRLNERRGLVRWLFRWIF